MNHLFDAPVDRPAIETIDTGKPLKWMQIGELNFLTGNEMQTELPQSVFGTRNKANDREDRINILPARFDDLQDGEYRIAERYGVDASVLIARNETGVFFTIRQAEPDGITTLRQQHDRGGARQARFVPPFDGVQISRIPCSILS